MTTRTTDTRPFRPLVLLLVVTLFAAAPALAQDRPNDEPSSFGTLMDRTDLGNVAQAATMLYHAGLRDLERARKLRDKAAEESDAVKRGKLEKKVESAYESAIGQLTEAVQTNPKLVDGYAALGRALLETGQALASAQVHTAGLRQEPTDPDNLEGRGAATLALGQLGEAARTYTALRTDHPEHAGRLLRAMKSWVGEHRSNPAGVDPQQVEALATLIAEWEAQG